MGVNLEESSNGTEYIHTHAWVYKIHTLFNATYSYIQ
jgi:hypothetical protein